MSAPDLISRLVIAGANHRTSPLALRDALFVEDVEAPAQLAAWRAAGPLSSAVALSTCDRVEVIGLADHPEAAGRRLCQALFERAGEHAPRGGHPFYVQAGDSALKHLFAVASSLDSMVVGEPQILGQVKAAHQVAKEAGHVDTDLDGLFQAAYACAKRVRTETAVAEGPVSVATAAIQVAADLFGELDGLSGLLLGAGEMGELVAESLKSRGLSHLTVAAPRETRARDVARRLGAHVADFEARQEALLGADVVICCTGGRHLAVTEDGLRQVLKRRRQRPIFLIDVSLPGDVEPAVERLDNAFLYGLEDLERIAEQNRGRREANAQAAWAVVEQEVTQVLKSRRQRGAVPVIVALRAHFEAERRRVLAELGDDAERTTERLIQRLLHGPSEGLRQLAEEGFEAEARALVRRLFPLDETPPDPESPADR